MKKLILFSLLSFGLYSCSSDDNVDVVIPTPQAPDENFSIPLNNGNYWTYDVEGNNTTLRDSLYISGDTLINSIGFKKFKTKDNISTGFYSTSLRNNGVRVDNQLLLMSGELSFGQGQTLPVGLDLTLDNFIIFKKNATNGEVLNTKSGSFNQTFNNTPLTIEYTLRSVGGENFSSYTSPNGDVYQDVKSSKIIVNLKVTSTQVIAGFPITVTILQPQDVVISTQYLAKNIGVVHTNTVTTYSIDANIAAQIGIPATNTQTQNEYLDVYSVN